MESASYNLSNLVGMLPILSIKGTDCFQKLLMFSLSITFPLDTEKEKSSE